MTTRTEADRAANLTPNASRLLLELAAGSRTILVHAGAQELLEDDHARRTRDGCLAITHRGKRVALAIPRRLEAIMVLDSVWIPIGKRNSNCVQDARGRLWDAVLTHGPESKAAAKAIRDLESWIAHTS